MLLFKVLTDNVFPSNKLTYGVGNFVYILATKHSVTFYLNSKSNIKVEGQLYIFN